MTCSPFDLKDYFFGELNAGEMAEVELHAKACEACREELVALSATRSAVLAIGEEEPPRRIAFVSDKVFEPRWWQKLLSSGPQLGFASAAMLAAAIVFHAAHTPTSLAPAAPVASAATAQTDHQKVIEAEVAKRLDLAVKAALEQSEARQAERLLQVVDSRLLDSDRRAAEMTVRTIDHYMDINKKRSLIAKQASFLTPASLGDIQ